MNFSEDFGNRITKTALSLGVSLSPEQSGQLVRYFDMLAEKNKVMNLTAVTDEDGVLIRHFADSLAGILASGAGKDLTDGKALSLIDVGTGAGLPGMVLKIVFPELKVTLFDSLNKRLVFLNEVIEALGLAGITTVHGRAEDTAHDKDHREKYDIAVARAVADLSVLSEYCLPFVKAGGRFVSYKASGSEEEIQKAAKAITVLGGKTESVSEYDAGDGVKRLTVTVRKEKQTPGRFPRKAGTPSKEPIQ